MIMTGSEKKFLLWLGIVQDFADLTLKLTLTKDVPCELTSQAYLIDVKSLITCIPTKLRIAKLILVGDDKAYKFS